MAVRVYKLAAELGMTSKELIAYLGTQGHKVGSHMATVEDTVAVILRDRLRQKTPAPKEKAVKSKAAATPEAKAPAKKTGKRATVAAKSVVGSSDAAPAKDGAADTKVREREREAAKTKTPKRVRYFPSDDYIYQQSVRFGGGMRRKQRPRGSRGGDHDQVAVAPPERPEKIEVDLPVTVKDLSSALGMKAQVLIKTLFQSGKMVTINQYLDENLVMELGIELGTEITFKKKTQAAEDVVRALEDYESKQEDLVPRAPVVTFLGHVDHGKTSLLDKIRETSVTQREAGGITQHIGAYRVDKGDVHVAFIDTPGHHAFTEMRARGANVTDVAVLVVAADDGPMPQTEEAINHARAANVPIVVALNKVDKSTSNPQRCKEALAKLGLNPVEWNGDTEYVEVSALTGVGVDHLLETLSLESQILELKADPNRPAVGVVLEAEATPSRGVLATVLVQDGTLRVGDYVLCGPAHGRVRTLLLNGTDPTDEAGPAVPVKVVGLSRVPDAGDKLYVFQDVQQARNIADARLQNTQESERAERQKISSTPTLEELFKNLEAGLPELRLVIKADVRGSIEALRGSLENLGTDEVTIRLLHSGVGAVSQEDVNLAAASKAIIIGFHVVADDRARALAEELHVEIRLYKVIYEVIEDIKAAMEARLAPESVEETHGRAEIRQVYRASKIGNIAGCMVKNGFILRSDRVRLIRDGVEVYEGELSSLKRFKDDVREVREGFECGLKITNYEDIKEGDVVESFTVVKKRRTLA